MLLAIDIGNSSINIGFFVGKRLIVQKLNSYPIKSPSEYKKLLTRAIKENSLDKMPSQCIISSVVPKHTEIFKKVGTLLFPQPWGVGRKEPLIVSIGLVKWLNFAIDNPSLLGADRVCGAVGAVGLFGVPVVVLDFGTATTVNFIGRAEKPFKGVFKGGAILPGIGIMADLLHKKTAKLPRVSLKSPQSLLSKSTEDTILSGIIKGSAGAVERIISDVEEKEASQYKVALTGGYAELISSSLKRIDFFEPNLTLIGMKFIYEKTSGVIQKR